MGPEKLLKAREMRAEELPPLGLSRGLGGIAPRLHITVVELLHDSEHAPVLPFKSRKA